MLRCDGRVRQQNIIKTTVIGGKHNGCVSWDIFQSLDVFFTSGDKHGYVEGNPHNADGESGRGFFADFSYHAFDQEKRNADDTYK